MGVGPLRIGVVNHPYTHKRRATPEDPTLPKGCQTHPGIPTVVVTVKPSDRYLSRAVESHTGSERKVASKQGQEKMERRQI